MIELRKINYISGDDQSISFGLSKVVDFLEMDGRNPILLSKPLSSNLDSSTLRYLAGCSQFYYISYNDFNKLLTKSNLFRVDLIIVDLLHLKSHQLDNYIKLLNTLNIDYIIISNDYKYIQSENILEYFFEIETINNHGNPLMFDSLYWITSKTDGWRINIDDLITTYIRDKKISGIIDKDGLL